MRWISLGFQCLQWMVLALLEVGMLACCLFGQIWLAVLLCVLVIMTTWMVLVASCPKES